MREKEILQEMVVIYKKYFEVIEQLGAITMSPQDKDRLEFLDKELKGL